MFVRTAIQALLALSMVGTAVADEAVENTAAVGGSLPISFGKCYRIQTQDRQWMAQRSTDYQGWHFDLRNSDVYKICPPRQDGSCEDNAGRAVNSNEDFFIHAFTSWRSYEPGPLAVNGGSNYFYPAWEARLDRSFHFQGTIGDDATTPDGIDVGGHNERGARGIKNEDGSWPISSHDDSTVRLWFHQWDCPPAESS